MEQSVYQRTLPGNKIDGKYTFLHCKTQKWEVSKDSEAVGQCK